MLEGILDIVNISEMLCNATESLISKMGMNGNLRIVSNEVHLALTRMPPKPTVTQTSAARKARKVRVDPRKLADSINENPPQKVRPKPTPLPHRPILSSASNRLSLTPGVTTPQKNDTDPGEHSGDEVGPKSSGGYEGGGGRESDDDHGHGDGENYSGGNSSTHETGNNYQSSDEPDGYTLVDSPNLVGSDDDEVELNEYDQYLSQGE